MIAAETTGRTAMLVEYDPAYCDTIDNRWQAHSGQQAKLANGSGWLFDDGVRADSVSDMEGVRPII